MSDAKPEKITLSVGVHDGRVAMLVKGAEGGEMIFLFNREQVNSLKEDLDDAQAQCDLIYSSDKVN